MEQEKYSTAYIAEKLGIDEKEITRRKTFVEFTNEDAEILKKARDVLLPFHSRFVDIFYDHILSFEELHEAVKRSGISLETLKNLHSAYFQSMISGCYDLAYFHNRLSVGLTHQRAGIEIKWYIGAFRKYVSELFDFLSLTLQNNTTEFTRLFTAITKIISIDIELAIDAYIYSSSQTIAHLEQRQDNLIQGIDGFIWEFDTIQHKYRYVSSKVESLLGYSQNRWMENPDFQRQIVYPEYLQETKAAFKKAIQEGQDFSIEYRIHSADGRPVWVSERVTAEKDHKGRVVLLRGLMLDIGDLKHHEEQLSYLATYDELTGLPNRNFFSNQLKMALSEAKRNNSRLAIMFLDLDGFKDVNDSLGHDAGDQLLRAIGNRLRELIRGADFVARFGGDEFCMVLGNGQVEFHPEHVAERCLTVISKPILIGTNTIYPGTSIGIAIFPDDANTPETLLQCADNAMYAAKSSGKNRYAFYNPEMTVLAERRLSLESDLRTAVEKGSFELLYQPQVSLTTGKMVAAEALLRWRDPVRGLISPDDFIPVAEKIGLITAIGEWTLKTASRQFVEWRKSGVKIDHISVNISGSHFRTGNLPETIAKVMQDTGIQASELEIEITEGVMQTGKESLDCFRKINLLGIKIAIDDFGTGYSCLSSLTKLPISCLKIDKAFIQYVLSNTNDSAIVATILSMSRVLKFTVVAEGVETIEQLNYLQGIGCDIVQGYYFSKPVTSEKIKELAATGFLPVTNRPL
ncbi:MAG: EAL domain-containing protein [Gammaproteobacteria bacterium]